MIKRICILLLLASPVMAGGPLYNYSDPQLNDEIANIYKQIRYPQISTGTAQNFTIVNSSATRLTALGISPTISAALGTIATTDSLSTMLSKIVNARIVQVVQGTLTGLSTTTSATFTNTTLAVTITPQLATNKILLIALGSGGGGTQAISYLYTLARGSTNLGGSNGLAVVNIATGGASQAGIGMVYLDSPSTTSATTYNVQFHGDGVRTVFWSDSNIVSVIVAIEIGQ